MEQLGVILFFSVHQYEKYSIYLKQSHEEAIRSIGRYLEKTKYKCLVFTPYGSNGLEYYANADLSGEWCT